MFGPMSTLADTPAARKSRGAFFTPPTVAEAVIAWAVRSGSDRVLEPSCGEAAFLVPAAARLTHLNPEALDKRARLVGVELHDASAERARQALAGPLVPSEIICSDFFALDASANFDAVVGNPPYVRYQGFSGNARSLAQQRALEQGVRMSGLASSWAPFTVHAAGFLAPHGRLGLVLPGEFLNRDYAASVRSFVLRRFSRVALVMFQDRVFPGVSEEVILLLAEGSGGTDHFELYDIKDAEALESEDFMQGSTRRWSPASSTARLTVAASNREATDVLDSLVREGNFVPLSSWGHTRLGIVTGANKYFTLSQSTAERLGIAPDETAMICPPGSRHVRRLDFAAGTWAELDESEQRTRLFRPTSDFEELSKGAQDYITAGSTAGISNAYKCRVRTPWWRVPDMAAPDFFVTYMNHDVVQICANTARVRCLNSLHGLTLHEEVRSEHALELLSLATLSTATLLSGEHVGRSFGGGMLQVLPREASRLLVPSPSLLKRVAVQLKSAREEIEVALLSDRLVEAVALVDSIVLEGLAREELDAVRIAHVAMRARRLSRGAPARV